MRNVSERVRQASPGGKRSFRHSDVADWLKSRRGTLGEQSGNASGTPALSETVAVTPSAEMSGNTTGADGGPSRARYKVFPKTRDVRESETSSPSEARAKRVTPTAKPLPELPADLADDIGRLIANDAALRHDGKIGDGIVAEGLLRLRRAFEKGGRTAIVEGIEIALRKRKGLAYAAGCARRVGSEPGAPAAAGLFEQYPVPPKRGEIPDFDPSTIR